MIKQIAKLQFSKTKLIYDNFAKILLLLCLKDSMGCKSKSIN